MKNLGEFLTKVNEGLDRDEMYDIRDEFDDMFDAAKLEQKWTADVKALLNKFKMVKKLNDLDMKELINSLVRSAEDDLSDATGLHPGIALYALLSGMK